MQRGAPPEAAVGASNRGGVELGALHLVDAQAALGGWAFSHYDYRDAEGGVPMCTGGRKKTLRGSETARGKLTAGKKKHCADGPGA